MLSLETLSLAKAYTDKIKEQLSVGFTPKIVESLPTLGQNNILYLVLKENGQEEGNIYNEYIWIDNKYEFIGNTDTSFIVDGELSDTSENPVQNKTIKAALSDKVDKIEGKGLSTNDYTNKDKDILDKLSKKFELIEQFTLTEDVTQIYRNQKPNGEAYNFNDVIMTLSIPIIEEGSTEAYGGTFMYIVNSETDTENNRVVAQGGVFKKGQVGNISVRAKIEGGIVFGTYGASAGNTSNKQVANTSYSNMNMLPAENITSVLFTFFGRPIFSGTTIKIYAR